MPYLVISKEAAACAIQVKANYRQKKKKKKTIKKTINCSLSSQIILFFFLFFFFVKLFFTYKFHVYPIICMGVSKRFFFSKENRWL